MASRIAQKNRTRKELLSTARRLMAAGEEVTLAKVAEAADMSRATVYRYFSDPGLLAADAALDIEVMPTHELLKGIEDVRARVHKVARYYVEFTREHEGQFRQFLARCMNVWGQDGSRSMRGARRVAAFAEALEPKRSEMDPTEFDDLSMRLSMVTGIENHVVTEDVLKVDHMKANVLQAGVVDALLDRYLP